MTAWLPDTSLRAVPLDGVGALSPIEILYEFEGPAIFVTETANGVLLLAYLVEDLEDRETLRYLMSTTSKCAVEALKRGVVSVDEALLRGSLWLVDFDYTYLVRQVFAVAVEELPEDALPTRGTMLARETWDGM